jgi:predicted dehydrogenase
MNKDFSAMRVLVIGLGSMGKRRVRNLKANGVKEIAGFDQREDRRKEAADTYGIPVYAEFEKALATNYDAWIISVPPDVHHLYMKKALERKIPSFIEASVVDTDMEEIIRKAEETNVFFAPSCTLFFHPAIQKIGSLIKDGSLGKLSNFLHHSGQYLPDWHTYEKVSDYYVSNKATGGGREIVPFELSWITLLLGFPKRVACFYKKTIEIEGAPEIDDTYNLLMDYQGFMFNLCVDVVSRAATRRLVINGEKKQLYWDWNENMIKLYDPSTESWEQISYEISQAQSGYNKNITETMYNEEIRSFLSSIEGERQFPNTLSHDHRILKTLYAAEQSSDTNKIQILS